MSNSSNKKTNGSELPVGTRIRTEDGYVFEKQEDGSWSDGDMVFESLEDLDVDYRIIT